MKTNVFIFVKYISKFIYKRRTYETILRRLHCTQHRCLSIYIFLNCVRPTVCLCSRSRINGCTDWLHFWHAHRCDTREWHRHIIFSFLFIKDHLWTILRFTTDMLLKRGIVHKWSLMNKNEKMICLCHSRLSHLCECQKWSQSIQPLMRDRLHGRTDRDGLNVKIYI